MTKNFLQSRTPPSSSASTIICSSRTSLKDLWYNNAMKRSELEEEIRQVILASVEVDGLTAADLPSDAVLFGDGVGLDSIDALEIGAALRKKYQVKFKANSDENRAFFKSISTLADFIASNANIEIEG